MRWKNDGRVFFISGVFVRSFFLSHLTPFSNGKWKAPKLEVRLGFEDFFFVAESLLQKLKLIAFIDSTVEPRFN